eukprot:m.1263470 g.1263470  ORF g.1263470 m.1263470 type:complete len:104 (+) comp24734_c1_seq10:2777-3088(+)
MTTRIEKTLNFVYPTDLPRANPFGSAPKASISLLKDHPPDVTATASSDSAGPVHQPMKNPSGTHLSPDVIIAASDPLFDDDHNDDCLFHRDTPTRHADSTEPN